MTAVGMGSVPAKFEIGRVIGRMGQTLKAHGLALWFGVLLLVTLPQAATTWLEQQLVASIPTNPVWTSLIERFFISETQSFFVMILGVFATAWITLVMVGDRDGRPLTPLRAASQVFGRTWFVGVQGLLLALGFLLGCILLFIPGLIVMTMWAVSTPALVVEGISPMRSFSRSNALTLGSRGEIVGLAVTWLIPMAIISLSLAKVTTGGLPLKAANATPLMSLFLQPLLGSLSQIALGTGSAAAYVELVNIKEGGPRSSVADVFS